MSEVIDFKIRWGMVIDLDKCTGCGACMVACQAENNLAPQVDASNKLRALNWLTVYRLSNGKSFPDHEVAYLPRPCMQCGKPSCVSVKKAESSARFLPAASAAGTAWPRVLTMPATLTGMIPNGRAIWIVR